MVFSSSIFMYMGYSKTASLDINVNISDLFIRLLFKKKHIWSCQTKKLYLKSFKRGDKQKKDFTT